MKKFLLSIFCLFGILSYAAADEYSHTFASGEIKSYSTVTLSGVDWTLASDGGLYWGWDSNNGKGFQFGKGADPCKSLTLSTSGISGTITKIVLNTSGASSIAATANITVGGNAFGDEITLTKTATDYTFEGSAEGEIVISYTQTSSKAIYIKSITIEYTAGSTEAPAVEAPTFSIENGTYYNPFSVEITAAEGATVYYTVDGTEPTAESTAYSEAIAISEFGSTTTIKAIAVVDGESSNVASATYNLKVAAPEFSVKGGVYSKLTGMDALKFTTETEGATILYNNRGGDPKTAGSKTWGSLSVLSTATVKAVAFVNGAEGDSIFSDVVEEKYYISEIKPFEKATEFAAGEYLIAGDKYIATPLGETLNFGRLSGFEVTANGNFIETHKFYAFTFTEVEGGYTIQDTFGRYIYATYNSSKGYYYNTVNVGDTTKVMPTDDAAIWTVSLDEEGKATITNKLSTYTLNFSSSYKNFDTQASNAVLPTLYALGEYPTMVVTPENYATVPNFDKVTVTCEQGISYNETDECYAYYTVGYDYTKLEFDNVNKIDDNTIEFSFSTPIEDNGDYRVTFPEGLFTLAPNGLAIASKATSVSLTVDNPNILEVEYANPSNNATVKSIQYLYFEFNQDIFDNVNGAVIKAEDGTEYPLAVTYTDAWGENTPYNALCLKTAEPITAPGVYTFVLKKEYIYADSDIRIAEDVTYTFTIVESLKVVEVTPIAGTEPNTISEFLIEFNNDVSCWAEAFYVTGPNESEYFFNNSYDETIPANQIRIVSETPLTEAGTYTLYIENVLPQGSMNIDEAVSTTYEFTIGSPAAEFEVVAVTPSEPVAELSTITVEFSEEIAGVQNVMSMTQIYVGSSTNMANFTIEGKVLTITLWTPITAAGEYALYIPEGVGITRASNGEAVTMNGEYTFTVEEATAPFEVVAVTPSEPVAELSTITVEFSEEIAGTQDLMAMETIYVGSRTNACNFTVEGKVLTITLWTPITAAGEYALKVPASVGITRASNGEAVEINGEITFTVGITDSIEDVEGEEGEDVIYDLMGRRIENITTPGIYIVNGKKVLVK